MKAMLLAAGRGRRLAPLTDRTPKPLLPVHGQSLIQRILGRLKQAGIREAVINTHHLAEQIERTIGDGTTIGLPIRYSRESELLETGGGIKKALPLLNADVFIICNADIYTDFDFANTPPGLAKGDLAHLVLVPTPASRQSGDFDCSAGRIHSRGSDYVYAGIALIHRDLFIGSPQGAFSLRDLLFAAVENGRVSAQIHRGKWTDIGTPEEYARANAGPPYD
jgi:MurNAc alpha-1-phosphate uridylyltransferase